MIEESVEDLHQLVECFDNTKALCISGLLLRFSPSDLRGNDLNTAAAARALEDLVEACTLNTPEGKEYFAIGPVVGRISFASQQTRALNLVYALSKLGKIKAQQKVAVVGGGLAGLTLAAALLAYKCNVSVFETKLQKMHRQAGANHRFVHPSINWWPNSDGELDHTADLPFLDWHFTKCSRVFEYIDKQWAKLKSIYSTDLAFHDGRTAEDLIFIEANGTFTIECQKQEHSQNFSTVLVASGFEDEETVEGLGTASYWSPDDTHNKTLDGTKKRIVSGAGDGGVIDTLRMAYKFSEGGLAVRSANEIQSSECFTEIKRLISDAEDLLLSSVDNVKHGQIVAKNYKDAAQILNQESDFSDPTTGLLYSNFQSTQPKRVLLIDNTIENAFVSSAAPIHKLLLAYSMIHRIVEFEKTELVMGKGGKCTVNEIVIDLNETHVVIRHGAKQAKPKFVDEAQWNNLRELNRRLKGQNFKPLWDSEDPYPTPSGFHCKTNQTEAFLADRADNVSDLLNELGVKGLVATDDSRFVVVSPTPQNLPSTAFGFPIVAAERTDLRRFGIPQ